MKKVAAGIAILLLAVGACTGDDPSAVSPAGTGAQGQPCYPNGTCLGGLLCASQVCVVAAGIDAGVPETSTPVDDAGAGDAGDAGDAANATTSCGSLGSSEHPTCPYAAMNDPECSVTQPVCCPGAPCAATVEDCNPQHGAFECFSGDQCGPGLECCMVASVSPSMPGACADKTLAVAGGSACKTSCDPTKEITLCRAGACAYNKTCAPAALPLDGADGKHYLESVDICP